MLAEHYSILTLLRHVECYNQVITSMCLVVLVPNPRQVDRIAGVTNSVNYNVYFFILLSELTLESSQIYLWMHSFEIFERCINETPT